MDGQDGSRKSSPTQPTAHRLTTENEASVYGVKAHGTVSFNPPLQPVCLFAVVGQDSLRNKCHVVWSLSWGWSWSWSWS